MGRKKLDWSLRLEKGATRQTAKKLIPEGDVGFICRGKTHREAILEGFVTRARF